MKKLISSLVLAFMLMLNLGVLVNGTHAFGACSYGAADSVTFTKQNCYSAGCGYAYDASASGCTDQLGTLQNAAGISSQSLPVIIGNMIKATLGISGVIALIFIVWGGVKWMSSHGAEDKIKDARKLMISGIVGIAIIAAAYTITDFLISNISGAIGQ